MPRYLVVLEYDGTDFCGSQRQPGQRTVQGELESAVERLGGKDHTIFAGRTDSGVHASGQVVAIDLAKSFEGDRLARALNALLPRDVSVCETARTVSAFNPRYWAVARRYVYRVFNRSRRAALEERYAHHYAGELNIADMSEAAQCLTGQHHFGAFGTPPQGENCVRNVTCLDVSKERDTILVRVEADAFLRRMVRLIVGALLDVGRGKLTLSDLRCLLDEPGDRKSSSPAAPAKGLTLTAVAYERERIGFGTGLWWSSEPLSRMPSDTP